jgi:hypothetical protein
MNEPAFPQSKEDEVCKMTYSGMTLRDYFASKALTGIMLWQVNGANKGLKCPPNPEDDLAKQAYEIADDISKNSMSPTHPIRLGLALNFSVFIYEIRQETAKAVKMARDAFDEAIAALDDVEDDFYKDVGQPTQLLQPI